VQGPFAFGAANGLLRKVVPSIQQFDAVMLDLTEVRTRNSVAHPTGIFLLADFSKSSACPSIRL
jgi:hypothetical protein